MAAPRGIAWERSFSGGKESGDFFQLLSVRRLVDDSLLAVVREGYGASAIRFGLGGTVLSNATFFSAGLVYSAVADPFGSVVLVTQIPASASTYDVVIMKYDGLTGMKVWPGSARIRGVLFQGPPAAAIGPSGDVFVTAGVFGAALGSIDWATVCYDGRTGNILWGPAVYGDSMSYPRSAGPVDLTIDPSGDIVVIGFATPSDRSLWAAIKYRGATGEQIWGPVLIGAVSTAPPPTVCPGSCYSPPTFAKCAFDRNGNVFLAVSSFTAPYGQAWLTAKYGGATGSPIWGPVSHKTGTETDYDVPSAIGVNGNGDVVVGGSVLPSPYSNGGNFVSELVKYSSASGERIWGPFQVPSTAAALAFDGGGQVIVTGDGSTSSFDGRSGRKLWQENFGSAQAKVVVGSDGNVTSLAGAYVGFGLDQHPELQAVNYAGATGSTMWGPVAVRNRGALTWPLALLVDRNEETVLVTSSGQPGSILKYARDGRDLWGPVGFPFAASPTGGPAAAALDQNGDIVVANAEYGVAKYSGSTGTLLWGPTRVEGLDSRFTAVKTDPSGDVLMVAISGSGWAVLRFRGVTGELVWSSLYRPPFNSAEPADFGLDLKGDILVTGLWYGSNAPIWVTFKYSGMTGEPIWGPVLFDGVGYGNNAPKKLAVDGVGDVVVTGIGTSGAGLSRKTIKYSGRDGAILWGPSEIAAGLISNPASTALVIDATGDIFVAGGRVPDPSAQFPREFWSVVKLHGHTGELIWGPKDFPAPTRSTVISMTIDPKGNPTVAGSVWNRNNDEWMLIGYDSSTGDFVLGPEIYDTGNNEQVSQIAFAGPDLVLAGTSEGLARTVRYTTSLAIATLQRDLAPAPALCGAPFLLSLAASNGTAPLAWQISGGRLPVGVELDSFSGQLSGAPSESGSFSFDVRVRDATGATAERGFTIDVLDGEPYLTVLSSAQDVCLPGQYTLSVPGTYASYHWLPGGDTTPEITVCPYQPTIYSVTVGEVNGCERRGSIELQPFKIELIPREPLVPPGRKRPKPIH